MPSGPSVNNDTLINVSRNVLAMLMSQTRRLAVKVLVEMTGHDSQEWMKATESGWRIDAEMSSLKRVLNRMRRAGLVRARPRRSRGCRLARSLHAQPLSAVIQAIDDVMSPRNACSLQPLVMEQSHTTYLRRGTLPRSS